jgi:hypothetical protein
MSRDIRQLCRETRHCRGHHCRHHCRGHRYPRSSEAIFGASPNRCTIYARHSFGRSATPRLLENRIATWARCASVSGGQVVTLALMSARCSGVSLSVRHFVSRDQSPLSALSAATGCLVSRRQVKQGPYSRGARGHVKQGVPLVARISSGLEQSAKRSEESMHLDWGSLDKIDWPALAAIGTIVYPFLTLATIIVTAFFFIGLPQIRPRH